MNLIPFFFFSINSTFVFLFNVINFSLFHLVQSLLQENSALYICHLQFQHYNLLYAFLFPLLLFYLLTLLWLYFQLFFLSKFISFIYFLVISSCFPSIPSCTTCIIPLGNSGLFWYFVIYSKSISFLLFLLSFYFEYFSLIFHLCLWIFSIVSYSSSTFCVAA